MSYILVLFNLAIRFPSALYVLEAFRIHIRYMRIGCMQSTLWPILMTMLIWNDLMTSQHDNLSRGSPRLMTSDRQILYPQRHPGSTSWADPASRLCSTSQENPTSTAAYFPGHHLRHAATDIPNREPAVASAFWLTRKLPSAASAAALTGCLPR